LNAVTGSEDLLSDSGVANIHRLTVIFGGGKFVQSDNLVIDDEM
jgi:hypothetical protein